jgi:hypothetical protein
MHWIRILIISLCIQTPPISVVPSDSENKLHSHVEAQATLQHTESSMTRGYTKQNIFISL